MQFQKNDRVKSVGYINDGHGRVIEFLRHPSYTSGVEVTIANPKFNGIEGLTKVQFDDGDHGYAQAEQLTLIKRPEPVKLEYLVQTHRALEGDQSSIIVKGPTLPDGRFSDDDFRLHALRDGEIIVDEKKLAAFIQARVGRLYSKVIRKGGESFGGAFGEIMLAHFKQGVSA